MPPDGPGMPACVFAILVLDAHVIELLHHNLAIGVGDVFFTTLRNPELFDVGVDFVLIGLHKLILRVR